MLEKYIKIKPLKLNNNIQDKESGDVKIKPLKEDLYGKIETGELENFLYDLAGTIKLLKEKNTPKEEILKIIEEAITFQDKEEEKENEKEAVPEPVNERINLKDILENTLKSEIEFTDGHWLTEEEISIKSGKKISGKDRTSFNIASLVIDIPEEDLLVLGNINWGSSESFKGLVKILGGRVIFNNINFNRVKLECEGKSKVDINNCTWTGASYPVKAKDEVVLSVKNASFKEAKVPLILSDNADISNLEEFVKLHPHGKDWLMGSSAAALKLIKLNNINIYDTLLKVKNIKLSGVFTLNNTVKIHEDNFSIEGFGEEGLTVKTDLKQLFLVTNKGKLKCKNVTFEFASGKREYKPSEEEEYEEIKEPGFIHLQKGYLELINCKIKNTCNGIYIEKKSEAAISDSSVTNNNRGIYINNSRVKIEKSLLEGNGVSHKDQPQIKIDNHSDVLIKESSIINSVDDSGLYIGQSKVKVEKSSVKRNDIGISVCDEAELEILDSEINNNRREGIYSPGNSRILIKGCKILSNKSNGIVVRDHSEAILLNSVIKENIKGLDIRASTTKVSQCEFDRNVRGIYVSAGSLLELEKSAIINSKLNGLYIERARVELRECKIKNNCIENEDYYQVYVGKKSILKGIDTEISEAPEKLKDLYSEFENSRVIFEASQIEGGLQFGHKQNGCFITTATCITLGKDDNCYELNKFREFRDKWLKDQKNGRDLIEEYYSLAPVIVDNINKLEDKDRIYENIWIKYLSLCLEFIEKKQFRDAGKLYIKMVNHLRKAYL